MRANRYTRKLEDNTHNMSRVNDFSGRVPISGEIFGSIEKLAEATLKARRRQLAPILSALTFSTKEYNRTAASFHFLLILRSFSRE